MILFGITGSIAAYKMCSVVSYFHQQKSMHVEVMMTEAAKRFVTPLTFASLSHNPVIDDALEWSGDGEIKHIKYSEENILVIAPATANTIAKMANGIADNVLTSTYLAFQGTVLLFPAMNTKMYKNTITKENLTKLNEHLHIIRPASGKLACGDEGEGKLPSTRDIIKKIEEFS